MRIDPELAAYYARVAAALPPAAHPTIHDRRARLEAIARHFPPPADDVTREDVLVTLPGRKIVVRLYRPGPGPRPAMAFFHGGGWVAGSVATHDGACAALARNAGIIVASVEYRRAPESPFPGPNDDAYGALDWLATHAAALGVEPGRLAVGGDSAGAHLAAGVALEARDRGLPLVLQLLVYPCIEPDFDTPSYVEHAVSPSLSRADMIEYWRHYLGDDLDARDARAVPSRAASHSGVAPAHIVVAELDPLRDDGVRYARQLRDAGVPTTLVEVPRLTHGFLRAAPYARAADEAQRTFAQVVAAALASHR